MGLDTTHDAFHGAYSAFGRFKKGFIECIGGRIEDNPLTHSCPWYFPEGMNSDTHPGIYEFMCHSDCDGEISPEMCARIADEMEQFMPQIEALGSDWGHILARGGFAGVAKRWIDGCRRAALAGEPLEFR